MKKMKKLAGVLLAMVMVLALAVPAFAQEIDVNKGEGKITITNTINGSKYSIYQIFKLDVSEPELDADGNRISGSGAYSYTLIDAWKNFVTGTGAGAAHVTLLESGGKTYVTWNGSDDAAVVAQFAKDALAFAKANRIEPVAISEKVANDGDSVVFKNLELGYYLVDSTAGTICSLDSTDKEVSIADKNEKPTVDKTVTGPNAADDKKSNNASIGDTVHFVTKVKAVKGAKGYVLHDKMDAGLTLVPTSITVSANYKGTPTITTAGLTDGCAFEIVFDDDVLAALTGSLNDSQNFAEITVEYDAVLNENAVIFGDDVEAGVDENGNTIVKNSNDNDTWLKYGTDSETTHSTTQTYSYKFQLVKIDGGTKVQLSGAEFELYDSTGKRIPVEKKADSDDYRVIQNPAEGVTGDLITAGDVTIEGLGNGTYRLKEITPPSGGYNVLKDQAEIEISDANAVGSVFVAAGGETAAHWTDGGLIVENNKGAELPSTGGIGTTIFYIGGGILVLAAVVVLITKRRASANDE